MYCYNQCPQPWSRPPQTHTSTGDSLTFTGMSGTVSCGVTALFLGSWCTRFYCAIQESISQSCVSPGSSIVGFNGDLLQEGLCHTQVCCTQIPYPCGRPPPICTSTGDAQTQFCLSLCGVSGSWCNKGLFEPSEYFW